jgi:hypothetical protein
MVYFVEFPEPFVSVQNNMDAPLNEVGEEEENRKLKP